MHCELLKAGKPQSGSQLAPEEGGSAAVIFSCLVLSIVLVVVFYVLYIRVRVGHAEDQERIQTSHIHDDAAKSPIMEEVDFEDEPMEDIELF